jgi:hypothetical protein
LDCRNVGLPPALPSEPGPITPDAPPGSDVANRLRPCPPCAEAFLPMGRLRRLSCLEPPFSIAFVIDGKSSCIWNCLFKVTFNQLAGPAFRLYHSPAMTWLGVRVPARSVKGPSCGCEMGTKKISPPGGENWLRTFYRLCGLDSARAENAISGSNKEVPAADDKNGKRRGRPRGRGTSIFVKPREPSA